MWFLTDGCMKLDRLDLRPIMCMFRNSIVPKELRKDSWRTLEGFLKQSPRIPQRTLDEVSRGTQDSWRKHQGILGEYWRKSQGNFEASWKLGSLEQPDSHATNAYATSRISIEIRQNHWITGLFIKSGLKAHFSRIEFWTLDTLIRIVMIFLIDLITGQPLLL